MKINSHFHSSFLNSLSKRAEINMRQQFAQCKFLPLLLILTVFSILALLIIAPSYSEEPADSTTSLLQSSDEILNQTDGSTEETQNEEDLVNSIEQEFEKTLGKSEMAKSFVSSPAKQSSPKKSKTNRKRRLSAFERILSNCVETIFATPFNNFLFLIFMILLLGYLLGSIKIRGLSMGAAGVFFIALLFGYFGYGDDTYLHQIGVVRMSESVLKDSLKIIQDLGLLCFITSVGFVAGPKFFVNLKRNITSYALVALVIGITSALSCIFIIKWTGVDSSMMVGILSGALTTTPGFAAAQDVVRGNDFLLNEITVGHAIGYPFGVLGVVFFVQIVPVLFRANIEEEQKKMNATGPQEVASTYTGKLVDLDPIGIVPFCVAIILGVIVGKIVVPLPGGASFSLGTTGGTLLAGLLMGHYGHIGSLNVRISREFARHFREFGLALFLIGAGVPGGSKFVEVINEYGVILFVFGAMMGTIPMLCGFLFAKFVLKLCLFNALGSITGGMTSTPGLGALINTTKTEDVAAADAATYPIALILMVLACQQIVKFM